MKDLWYRSRWRGTGRVSSSSNSLMKYWNSTRAKDEGSTAEEEKICRLDETENLYADTYYVAKTVDGRCARSWS